MLKVREVALPALLIAIAVVGAANASQDGTTSNGSHVVSQDCKVGAIATTSSDLDSKTNSTGWTDLDAGAVTFNQQRTGCIVVNFTAVASGGAGVLLVQALLDGVTMFPNEIQLSDNRFAQSYAASWTGSADAGSHTVQIQFRTGVNGQFVEIFTHTTEVAHK
jgi:hypothetical protein